MKILVLSDSHASLSFMRYCVRATRPDSIIHLGDFFDDGAVLAQENPGIVVHQVPGNCDRYRSVAFHPETLCYDVFGVRLYMTHGHNQRVKFGLGALIADGLRSNAQAVLFGHTHIAHCSREENGMWVLNPGTCGTYGGSCGLMEVENEKIIACRILTQADLEEML